MIFLIEKFGFLPAWFFATILIYLRYAIMAGLLFWLLYQLKPARLISWKIQKKATPPKFIIYEISHSLSTAVVFGLVGLLIAYLRKLGLTQIYTDINAYPLYWLPLSFFLIIFLHDTYFYWVHRMMHHPGLFKIFHKVHHHSSNPTPWAALSFHPLEAVVEIAIIPIFALVIPFHPIILLIFASWSLLWNVIGHAGFELFPSGFVRHPLFKWFNTATHHNMHHAKGKGNFSLYFNFWDRIMGTNFPEYEETFEAVKKR